MTNDYYIVPMTSNDIDQVWEIEKLCFNVPWSRESFRLEVEKNQCACYFVAKIEGRVVGYGGMWLVIDEGHITNIAVHPDYRGRGIGEALMRNLMKEAVRLNMERMTLEVRVSNHIAQRLYKKLGFQEGGIRKGYYSNDHEDALIMWNFHIRNFSEEL
jgi:ribosomal-protein-alanine N-acetyltransferase